MYNFKGFGDWVEIFRGGSQKDSMGRVQNGDDLIDNAVNSFNKNRYEPPIVIGHPKDNNPAYGWVDDLKAVSVNGIKTLFAKFRQVLPEFEEMVKRGLFKKRSASFYKDGTLRHVGFLGAAPPAVKGLADIKFNYGGNSMTFDFSDTTNPGEKLSKLIKEEMKSDETLDYSEAFKRVQVDNPELTQEYCQALNNRG